MLKVIVHIDLNAFFASVEVLKDPSLKGKPLIVGGSFKRGVVSTASYEARKYGIHSGMPIAQAYKLCPTLINKEVDFNSYNEYSKKFFKLVKEKCGNKIEVASIDECYIDFSEIALKINDVEGYLKDFQMHLKNVLGLGSSIGVAPNKFLAKMASNMQKPMGFVILRKRDIEQKLWPLPIGSMYGIGKKTAPRLIEIGVKTIGDLAKSKDNYEVINLLGKSFYTLIDWANGIDKSDVIDYEIDPKSIGNSSTFEKDISEIEEVKNELKTLSKSVSNRIIGANSLAFGIAIVIKFSDFSLINRSTKFEIPICNEDEIYVKALKLFEDNYKNDKLIRLLGITLFDIKEKSSILSQMNIYDLEINKESTREIINQLNKLLGKKLFITAQEIGSKNA